MAVLELNETYRLVSGENEWTLQKVKWYREDTKAGQELVRRGYKAGDGRIRVWEAYRYHPDLSDGLTSFLRLHVMTSDANGIAEIRREFQAAKAMVADALASAGLEEEWNPSMADL